MMVDMQTAPDSATDDDDDDDAAVVFVRLFAVAFARLFTVVDAVQNPLYATPSFG
jgi:hypothetical protein